jgi:signal transduction histidine kinase
MNGIIGMTDLALRTEFSDEQREYLAIAKDSARALLALINDILDYSRIEAGRLSFERIPFNPSEMLEGMMKPWRHRCREKHLTLTLTLGPEMPATVVGDPGRLRQVVDNLFGNALKFTERGEIAVTVEVVRWDESAAELRFTVRDSGIGIPPEKLLTVFEPFVQAESPTTRRYGGVGLGLSISQRLVSRMGGRLWVESQPGRGSTFHFTARFELPQEAGRPSPGAPSGA